MAERQEHDKPAAFNQSRYWEGGPGRRRVAVREVLRVVPGPIGAHDVRKTNAAPGCTILRTSASKLARARAKNLT